MNAVQERLLSMLDFFHDYCVENNLRYYVVGGSMLGAVRHGGFIPWDDDIDVAMPRPDYERLIGLFTDKIDNYILESPYSGNRNFVYSFSKLYDTDTTLVEHTRRDCRRGIYIDVFPLDGVGNTEQEVDRHFSKVDRLNMFLMTMTCAYEKRRGFAKNAAIFISRMIPSFIIDAKKLSIKLDKLASSFGYDCKYVANLMGAYRRKEIIERRIIGKPTEYRFENITVYGVEYYDEFLTHIYGDWRKLPPEDKRKTAHDYIELDLNKSYLE